MKNTLLTIFDPWKDKLCTCPLKYSFNPYTGCMHQCRYCYITSYIRNGFKVRPKKNLLLRLQKEIKNIDYNLPISMSNSTDPYQPIEKSMQLTRNSLKIFSRYPVKLLVTTKSDLVTRDIDLLLKIRSAVMLTITTLDEKTVKKLEPYAPLPKERLKAIKKLSDAGIPVGLRLDPIIYGLNDSEDSIKEILEKAKKAGIMHVVSSTFKPRPDSWKRVVETFPEIKETKVFYKRLKGTTFYLKKELRFKLMKLVRSLADELKISFATCREGFIELHTAKSCDGTHLISYHPLNKK